MKSRLGRVRYRPEPNYKKINRVLIVLLAAAVIAAAFLLGRALENDHYKSDFRTALSSRVVSDCKNAKSVADKLGSSVSAGTATSLSNIKMYVYNIDQLNKMSIRLYGEEGRLVPEDALDALYRDLDAYFSLIQTNTTSLLETRTLLINRLAALDAVLTNTSILP